MSNTRSLLIDTMKQLLWERGYDATSPNHVLERSGVGKGSFYHHFKSKKALAIAALDARADELLEEFDTMMRITDGDWLDKVSAYLQQERDALKGCRIGRIVQDPSVADPALAAPIQRYFSVLHERLTALYTKAQAQGQLSVSISPQALATMTLSVVQGGFIVGQALVDRSMINEGCWAFVSVLNGLSIKR